MTVFVSALLHSTQRPFNALCALLLIRMGNGRIAPSWEKQGDQLTSPSYWDA